MEAGVDVWPAPINVSALNQYAYCPRRCALIYVSGEFADNLHTARGNAEHAKVDRVAHTTTRDGARVEYALPIWSDRLGLIGKCDVVEFWPDGSVYPVEYKHGPRWQRDNDDAQLTAQALCLEEMLGRDVTRGAIFHAKSKRRREVAFDIALRSRVELLISSVRQLLASAQLPAPVNDERCGECSMRDICVPQTTGTADLQAHLRSSMFDPDAA